MVCERTSVLVPRQLDLRHHVLFPQCVNTLLCRIFQRFLPVCLLVYIRNVGVGARQIHRVKIPSFLHVKGCDLLRQSIVKRSGSVKGDILEIRSDLAVDLSLLRDALGVVDPGRLAGNVGVPFHLEVIDAVGDIEGSELLRSAPFPVCVIPDASKLAGRIERLFRKIVEGLDTLLFCDRKGNDLPGRIDAFHPRLQDVGGAAVAAVGRGVHVRRVHLAAALGAGEDSGVDLLFLRRLLLAGHMLFEPFVAGCVIRIAVRAEKTSFLDIVGQICSTSGTC